MSRHNFIKGAFILSVSALISKILGLFYVIPLKHFAGDEGLALYQAVFPIYNTLLILSVSGIPIAMSKLISENLASGRPSEVYPIMKSSLGLMASVALLGFLLFYLGAQPIASQISNLDTALSIQMMALAMLLVPFVAVLRGYFYGHQRMNISALSQVFEQLMRVGFMIAAVYWLTTEGREMAEVAAGAAMGSVVGLAFALVFLFVSYFRFNKDRMESHVRNKHQGYGWKIISIAIPVSLSTLMVPLLGMVDSVTMIQLLEKAGLSEGRATVEFGIYSRGVPLVQFASFYATGIAVAIVPALSAIYTGKQLNQQVFQALKLTTLAGVPAGIGMMIIARPLNILLYGNDQGSDVLMVLAASTFFLSLSVVGSGILQGLGKQVLPVLFLVIGLVVKVGGNMWLIPHWGNIGAAYSTLASYAVISFLCMLMIMIFQAKGLIRWVEILRWIGPSIGMGCMLGLSHHAVYQLSPFEDGRLHSLFVVALFILIGLVSYVIGLLLFRTITWEDIRSRKLWSFNRS